MRKIERAINVEDVRRLARRRLPRMAFDYIDGGAEDELSVRANREGFDEITFAPRFGVALDEIDTAVTVAGARLSMPVILGPCGQLRIAHPDGEAGAARAAARAGIPSVLSAVSGHSIEQVGAAGGDLWYQVYLVGGKEVAAAAVERARRAGFKVLVLTVDTPTGAQRERDIRNGIGRYYAGSTAGLLQLTGQSLRKVRWGIGYLRDGRPATMPNVIVEGHAAHLQEMRSRRDYQRAFTWEIIEEFARSWDGPVFVKGLLTARDAELAGEHGASGVIVSNHGGRQLESAPATIAVLPSIVAAVGNDLEVLLDGGVRRGRDVAKALALGARAVLVGRAYAFGLGAGGERGVDRVIAILRDEFRRTLGLLGCARASELDETYITNGSIRPI